MDSSAKQGIVHATKLNRIRHGLISNPESEQMRNEHETAAELLRECEYSLASQEWQRQVTEAATREEIISDLIGSLESVTLEEI